jgi:hypothetical protein
MLKKLDDFYENLFQRYTFEDVIQSFNSLPAITDTLQLGDHEVRTAIEQQIK